MKRFWSVCLAAASLWLFAAESGSARPRYGGTLRLATPGIIRTLDPTAVTVNPDDAAVTRQTLPLVFETLLSVAPTGGLRPWLATSWNTDAQGTRWHIRLRDGVLLHDGSTLDASQVVESLRATHKEWQVSTDGGAVVIETERAAADVPWELTELRSAVSVRRRPGELLGTGPFRVEQQGVNRLLLRAHDNYWGSRAFLDAIELDLGRTAQTLLTGLELGRIDIAAVQPADRRRLSQRGLRTVASRPLQLFALVFEVHRASAADDVMRRAVASTLDRDAICRVLLQDYAEPAEAILPSWLSGYQSFVLSRPVDSHPLARDKPRPLSRDELAKLPRGQRALTLRVDPADLVAKSIAERIAVDAREAGFALTVQAPAGLAPRPDVRLLRMRLWPTSPDRALAGAMAILGPRTLAYVAGEPAPAPGASLTDVYRVERALLARGIIIPVVHVPDIYGLGERLDSWNGPVVSATGALNLADVWLRTAAP
jgi:peptide/nickel transport system substrate-binding protein